MGNITNPILQKYKNSPSLAATYGPYISVQAAHEALSDDRLNIEGMTVGIQPTNSSPITEYWYKGGTTQTHLVPKGTNSFANIEVGADTLTATGPTDTLTITAGDNVHFTVTPGNRAFEISANTGAGDDAYSIEIEPSLVFFNVGSNGVVTETGVNKSISIYGRAGKNARGAVTIASQSNITLPNGFSLYSYDNGTIVFYANEGASLATSAYVLVNFTYDGISFSASIPVVPTIAGRPGEDADNIEWIYNYTNDDYDGNEGEVSPQGQADGNVTNKNQDDWVPNGWYDQALSISATSGEEVVYASYRVKNGSTHQWGDFQEPVVWSNWGHMGTDGDGVEYVFVRTKDDVKPIVVNDTTYTDSYSRNYTADEHLPKVRVANNKDIIGNTHYDAQGYKTEVIGNVTYNVAECTDDPVGIDSVWQYEWVIKRTKSAPNSSGVRTWNAYVGEMSLWANWGKEGKGIASVTKQYSISEYNTTADDSTAPADASWQNNSPAATTAKPYLWVKETTSYTDGSASTIKYYCIGKYGDNGIDAKDFEWVYIRTKTPTPPEIDEDATYTDSNSKTYTSDDHLPKVVGNINIESNNSGNPNKLYECTDDPKGVTDVWKYEWEIKRTKGSVKADGSRDWNYYQGTMTLHNNYAESAFIIDTDNDNDQFGVDSDNKVITTQIRSTRVWVYDGATPQHLNTLNATLEYEDGTSVDSGVATVSYAIGDPENPSDDTVGVVSVTVLQNNTPLTSHTEIQAHITASVTGKGNKSTVFTLLKVVGGAPGVNPVIWNVAATNRVLSFQRDPNTGELTPDNRSTTVNMLRTEGNESVLYTIDSPNPRPSGITIPTYSWGFDDGAAEASAQTVGNTITITKAQANAYSTVWIQLSTGDRETLSIVKDGLQGPAGKNSVRIDLDNQEDLVSIDGEGKVRFTRDIVTHARIYDGGTSPTEGVSKAASLTNAQMLIGTSGVSTATVSNVVNGIVTITWHIEAGDTVVATQKTITLVYNRVEYSAVFSLGVVASEIIYQVLPNPSEVSFVYDSNNTLAPDEVLLQCGYTKTTGGGTTSVVAATTSATGQITEGGKGLRMYIFYRTKSSGVWSNNWNLYSSKNASSGITVSSGNGYEDYEFAISSSSLISDSTIVDREAVPIVKGGTHGTSPIYADIDNEMDGVICDENGATFGNSDQSVSTRVSIWKGSSRQPISSLTCKIGDTVLLTDYTNNAGTVTDNYKATTNTSTGDITVTVKNETVISSKIEISIYVSAEVDGVTQTRILTLTINGVRGGANAVIYNLLPSSSEINVDRTDAGGYDPTTYNLTCGYTKVRGNSAPSTSIDAPDSIDGYYIYFRRRARSNNAWEVNYYRYGHSSYKGYVTSFNVTTYSAIEFVLCSASSSSFQAANLDTYTVLDKETVPVIADGRRGNNGANSIRLDLTNEMDSINTDSTGKIQAARTVTTVVHLYNGASEVDLSEITLDISGAPSSSIAAIAQTNLGKGKQVSLAFVAGQTMASKYDVVISHTDTKGTGSTDDDVTYSGVFTITASLGQAVYQLKPTPHSLYFTRNADNTIVEATKNVALSIIKIDGTSTTEYSSASSAGVTVRYGTSPISSSSGGTAWTSGNISVANSVSNLYIAMYTTGGALLDKETVPVFIAGQNGTSPYLADLDNEMDSVALTYEGAVDGSQSVYTNVSMFYGSSPILNPTVEVYDGEETSGNKYTSGTAKNGVTVTIDGGAIEAAFADSYDMHLLDKKVFLIKMTSGTEVRYLNFTVNLIKAATPGSHAALYFLVPDCNQIVKKKNGTYIPNSNIKCSVQKNVGGTTSTPAASEYTLQRSADGGSNWSNITVSSGIAPSSVTGSLQFRLKVSNIIVDIETIPIVEDGSDGKNSIKASLDNEHEDFIYSDSGKVAPTQITSQARLYDGPNEITTSAAWMIAQAMSSGITYSGTDASYIDSSTGLLTVGGLTANSAKVVVRAKYPNDSTGQYYYAAFTSNKIKQDKYDIIVRPNSIAFNSASYVTQTVNLSIKGTSLQGTDITPAPEISNSQTIYAGQFRVFYGYVKADGTIVQPSTIANVNPTEGTEDLRASSTQVPGSVCEDFVGVYFELRHYTSASEFILCDYETVEIAKSENGNPGNDSYLFEVSPYVMSWDTDADGNILNYIAVNSIARAYRGTTAQEIVTITSARGLLRGFTLDLTSGNGFTITPHSYYSTYKYGSTTYYYIMKRAGQYAVNDLVYDSSMMKVGYVTSTSSSGVTVSLDAGGSRTLTKTGSEYTIVFDEPVTATLTLQTGSISRDVALTLIPNMSGYNGQPGDDAVRLDLNNEHDSIMYAGSTKVGDDVTSQATLYVGGVEQPASSVGWSIYSTSGIPDSDAGRTLSSGLITVKQLTALHGTVVIQAKYPNNSSGNFYYATFSVDKVIDKPKYELKIDANVVAVNTDEYSSLYYPVVVQVTKTTINNEGQSETTVVANLLSEGLRLWSQNNSDTVKIERTGSYYSGYSYQVPISNESVTFYITPSSVTSYQNVAANIVDVEKIPVAIVQNGQSIEGKMGRNIYYAGTMQEVGNTQFVVTDYEAPYVQTGTDANGNPICYVFVGENSDGTPYTYPNSANGYTAPNWEQMTSEYKYLITNAVFSDFAKLGSGVFSGDYAFSQWGTAYGSSSGDYQYFVPNSAIEGSVQNEQYSTPKVIWKFAAAATSYTFDVELDSSDSAVVFSVSTTPSVSSKTFSGSSSTYTGTVTGLTIGTTYYLLVFRAANVGTKRTFAVTCTTNNFQPNLYINWLRGEIYAQLGRFVNVTVEGVLNNLTQTITDSNASDYGYLVNSWADDGGTSYGKTLFINPLKVDGYVKVNLNAMIHLPSACCCQTRYDASTQTYVYVDEIFDGYEYNGTYYGNGLSFEDMRKCIGKKLYILPYDTTNPQSYTFMCGGTLSGTENKLLVRKLETFSTGSTPAQSSDLIYVNTDGYGSAPDVEYSRYLKTSIQYYTTNRLYILECKLGQYNTKECIYWELQEAGSVLG